MARKRFTVEQIIHHLREAEVLIEQWRNHYNTIRPHSALGYRPPAPRTISPHRVDAPSEFEALRVNRRSSNVEHDLN